MSRDTVTTIDRQLSIINNLNHHVPTPLYKLEDMLGYSRSYLEKVASNMLSVGIISSVRGTNGGYILTKPLDDFYLEDILDIIPIKNVTLRKAIKLLKDTRVVDFYAVNP